MRQFNPGFEEILFVKLSEKDVKSFKHYTLKENVLGKMLIDMCIFCSYQMAL